MSRHRILTTASEYNGDPILADEKKGLAVDTGMLDRILAQFDCAEDTHSKTLFFRFDLRYPDGMKAPQDNIHFRHCISGYCKNLSRKGLAPRYIAVREQKTPKQNPHYHVAMMLDGQKTRNPHEHLKTADRLWANELGIKTDNPTALGLVCHCDKDKDGNRVMNGMLIDRTKDNYEDVRAACIRRASYLAKENQKAFTPKGQREYFASKLPKEYRQ